MSEQKPRRIYHRFTPEERARWEQARDAAVALEPILTQKLRRLREAAREVTFSGALRRAIHAHPKPLPIIASEAGVDARHLDEFLTGDRTLRSDTIDRLTQILGFEFPAASLGKQLKVEMPEESGPIQSILDPATLATTQNPTSNP
jgi:hypothetical protein